MKDLEIWSINQLQTTFRNSEKAFKNVRPRRSAIGVRQMIRAVLFVGCLFGLVFLSQIKVAAQKDFRVTEAVLKAGDPKMSGKCPIRVNFTGYVTANGAGTVKYTFARSDGATAPVYTLDFKEAGTQAVSTDWTLGDASALPVYDGWQTIKILSPDESESNREAGRFSIACDGKPGETEEKKSNPDAKKSPIGFILDASLKPEFPQMPGGKTDQPRPLASFAGPNGEKTDFVENELIVFTNDPGVLQKLIGRWNGVIAGKLDSKGSKLDLPAGYLIRIDTGAVDASNIGEDFEKLARKSNWSPSDLYRLRVSSEAGF